VVGAQGPHQFININNLRESGTNWDPRKRPRTRMTVPLSAVILGRWRRCPNGAIDAGLLPDATSHEGQTRRHRWSNCFASRPGGNYSPRVGWSRAGCFCGLTCRHLDASIRRETMGRETPPETCPEGARRADGTGCSTGKLGCGDPPLPGLVRGNDAFEQFAQRQPSASARTVKRSAASRFTFSDNW
jgi:hypothetical protein